MTKIKICGLKTLSDVEAVNKVKAEYAGFVFASTKRQVTDTMAKEMREALLSSVQTVGVFVNEPVEHVVSLCREGIIDIIQLHGDETEDYARALQGRVSNPIIRAIRVQSRHQIIAMQGYPCDYFLLDTYRMNAYGGTGESFDRSMIPKLNKPFFLAGGLMPETVACAIAECSPYCVDVSSGVETDGKKDAGKIEAFVKAVREQNL